MVIWNSALNMNKKILIGLSIAIVVIVGVLFGASQVSTSSSPTTTALPSLELNLREGEQVIDFRRLGIRSISIDADFSVNNISISQPELLPSEIQAVSNLVDFENEVLIGVGSAEDCAHAPAQEKMIISFQDEQGFPLDARLTDDCTDRLDVLSAFLVFTAVNRDDLPPELLVELDSMEEFVFPSFWNSIGFDIE